MVVAALKFLSICFFFFIFTYSFASTKDNNSDKEGTKRAKAKGFNPPNCSICFSRAETIISK